ncbi:MAG: hypothetical protein ACRYG6_11865 [Janthinobacterium lividum]
MTPGPAPLARRFPDLTRAPAILLACLLLAAPFLLAAIPPLTDVPGHMAAALIAAHAGDDPALGRFFAFRWHPVPNLGTDLVVAALQGALGVPLAFRLVAAAIPALLAAGILLLARTLNPRGAAAAPWALVFVWCFPLNTGFLNYMLGVAGALLALSAWIRLDRHPRLREAATWLAVPLLFLCHVVAGCLFVMLVGSRELAPLGGLRALALVRSRDGWRRLAPLLRRVRPLLCALPILVAWRLDAASFAGRNRISLRAKADAILMILRDQDMALDVASLCLACAVLVVGWRRGARPHPAVTPALLALCVLFAVMPSSLSGSSYADERLLPLLPMLAFATQDWSGVRPRLARAVSLCGLALLAVRLAATAAGFVAYDASYRAEAAALPHIAEHSRVLVLNTRECSFARNWRGDRLDHIGDLAIVFRRSWTNAQWDVDGAHLLQILYRPSPAFFDDPSQYVWPSKCGGIEHKQPTIHDALAAVPFDGIDDLWLIDTALPRGYRNPRLVAQWHNADSTLYSVLPR